mgnify:CR=1 FL=1
MYKCKHFAIHELVPPKVYRDRGEKAWELMDERILQTIDKLRDRFGAAIINNYEFGGDRKWSGLRTSDSPWFSPYSQHTFGRAVDVIFRDVTAEEVREELRNIYDQVLNNVLPGITAVEEDVDWLHIDCRNCERIKWFNA